MGFIFAKKKCKICRLPRLSNLFARCDGKNEAKPRRSSVCKLCKADRQRERDATKKANIQQPKRLIDQPNQETEESVEPGCTDIEPSEVLPANQADRSIVVLDSGFDHNGKAFNHPEYKDWEICKALNFFGTLKRWRDEARAKGQIDW